MDQVVHSQAMIRQDQGHYHRSSFHRLIVPLAAAASAIGQDSIERNISVRNRAPAFLSVLGIPIPSAMDGSPLIF